MRNHKRQILVLTAVGIVAALASTSALAAHGPEKRAPRGAIHVFGFAGPGMGGPMGMGMGMRGFGPGGPMFGAKVFGHGPFGHHGPRGLHGPGPIAGAILAKSASYIGITPAQLGAGLKEGKSLAEIAKANGKTAEGLVQALVDDAKAGLDAAVAAGWLTEAQAGKLTEGLTQHLTKLVNATPDALKGPKRGPLDPRGGPLEPAAAYLGLTRAELHTALRSGKSLAEIATERGKTVDGLVAALTADAKERLADAVAGKKLTQEQADKLLAGLTESVTKMVNAKPKAKPSPAASTTAALKTALKLKLVSR